eukprot:TRINITY_DN23628_c0_g2_i1.p1 TRINITY_DN23628_c0_g2~~TRINITY_DN23628_c0_g2_i1.p1  ORF type:complete len:300 (+),score=30.50 TRINITY_DN23628_c0_g2_i1:47-901(+)
MESGKDIYSALSPTWRALFAACAIGAVSALARFGLETMSEFSSTESLWLLRRLSALALFLVAGVCYVSTSSSRREQQQYTGVLKRFSLKNGWGTLAPKDLKGAWPGRHDVRIYRKDRDRLDLKVQDVVVFRVATDPSNPGWLVAKDVHRPKLQVCENEVAPESNGAGNADDAATSVVESYRKEASDTRTSQSDDSGRSPPETFAWLDKDNGYSPDPVREQQSDACSQEDVTLERPASTPVVARRLVHSHLNLRMSQAHRTEEKAFWKQAKQSESPTVATTASAS